MSRKKLIITAIVLVLILVIGGILAYFTDTETKTNTFKTGKVDIEVLEPSWPDSIPNPDYDPDDPTSGPEYIDPEVSITPNQEVAKDPIIKNKGDGIVYAFAEVTIPKMNVKIGDAAPAVTELFELRHITDATTTPVTTDTGVNAGWVKLDSKTEQIPATSTEPAKVKYVYAYATKSGSTITLKGLESNEQTEKPVFDTVKFADVDEDSTTNPNDSIQSKNFDVVVTGIGIQADGLSSDLTAEEVYDIAAGNN